MERPRAGGSGDLDLGGRRAREWTAKVEGINRGDQTAYGVAISLPRGREQLLDHGSKPLEGAPPATEYRSDVIFGFGWLGLRLRSRCATSPASYGTRSDNDTSLCSRNP